MKRTGLPLENAWLIEPEPMADIRGEFARTFCSQTFEGWGLASCVSQTSISYNTRRGTLRGMHYQALPHGEIKLVRCTRGAIFDVVIDLREDSPTRGRWHGVELSEHNRLALYVPEMCAHGFLTLADGSEVLYQMSSPHVPEAARGLRWDDPDFAVAWPFPPLVMSDRDRSYPDLRG